jgi:hypothetical protein
MSSQSFVVHTGSTPPSWHDSSFIAALEQHGGDLVGLDETSGDRDRDRRGDGCHDDLTAPNGSCADRQTRQGS